MGPHKVAVTFHPSFGFVAHANWLPDGQLCASSINALRAKVERMKPRYSMSIHLDLDRAATTRYSAVQALAAAKRYRAAPTLASGGFFDNPPESPVGAGTAQEDTRR